MRFADEVTGVDLYELLGVPRSATPTEIRLAYRQQVRASHPDLNPDDPRSGERMARVNLAGRVLLDAYLRAAYDRLTPGGGAPAARAWYEQRPSGAGSDEWISPPARPRRTPRGFRKFVRELRSFDAKLSLGFSEFLAKTPERARLPLVLLSIAGALLLLACARPRTLYPWSVGQTQPTTVSPNALNP
jgi:curved DNA-binding protein CbpA